MDGRVIDRANVNYLDAVLFDDNRHIRVLPAAQYKEFPHLHLLQWCVERGIYQLPTKELVEWLGNKINGRNAIEIGSGCGGLAKALGIPATDSFMQQDPQIKLYYLAMGQQPTEPPDYVEKLDAIAAVLKYKAEVVLGAYITQQWTPGDEDGNMFGPNEEQIVEWADYIFMGNEKTHGKKRILSKPHQTYKFDWLVSRGFDPALNVIWEWKR